MSTRHSTEKGLFGPFAQNLVAVDYFQHNQQLEMPLPAVAVAVAVDQAVRGGTRIALLGRGNGWSDIDGDGRENR